MTPSVNNNKTSLDYKSNIGRLSDTEMHDWYRFVFAYSDEVITSLIDEFDIGPNDLILDPFNGTGTTTLTAKKHGIDAIGVDASPASSLSARAKTNWVVDLDEFTRRKYELLEQLEPAFKQIDYIEDENVDELDHENGEVDLSNYDFSEPPRLLSGWICPKPRMKMQVVKQEINTMPDDIIQDYFKIAMIAILPEKVANISFGPTVYKSSKNPDVDVYGAFKNKIEKIEDDLGKITEKINNSHDSSFGQTEILLGDARDIGDILRDSSDLFKSSGETIDYVITSPPYPNERDYTRTQRLELIWLDQIRSKDDLKNIKSKFIRSNSKNIYVDDDDGEQTNIRNIDKVDEIINEMHNIIEEENIEHGFGQYYPRVIEEYFGGMCKHLRQIYDVMAPGGKLAYVVGDQQTYWRIEVPTGKILEEIAEKKVGFKAGNLHHWRNRQSRWHDEDLAEELLVLEKE